MDIDAKCRNEDQETGKSHSQCSNREIERPFLKVLVPQISTHVGQVDCIADFRQKSENSARQKRIDQVTKTSITA